jgi:hypothetical protein
MRPIKGMSVIEFEASTISCTFQVKYAVVVVVVDDCDDHLTANSENLASSTEKNLRLSGGLPLSC